MSASIRYTVISIILLSAISLTGCRSSSGSTPQAEQSQTDPIPSPIRQDTEMVEVVVDDQTGDILGIKANEVGDYYIINPSDEVIIPKEGHSIKMVSLDLIN